MVRGFAIAACGGKGYCHTPRPGSTLDPHEGPLLDARFVSIASGRRVGLLLREPRRETRNGVRCSRRTESGDNALEPDERRAHVPQR